MKNYHVIVVAGLCLLSSGVTYFGDRLDRTTSVDIYYSAHDVTKPYKVIGHLTCANYGQNADKRKLTAYAKKVGADAIVITGTTPGEDSQAAVVNADALKYTN